MDTFSVDLHLYKAHTPFEHIQYVVTGTIALQQQSVADHFASKGWKRVSSLTKTDLDFEYSRESHNLMGDLLSDRLPFMQSRDLSGDNETIKKWQRTQRWKDWSEEPAYSTNYRSGGVMECATFHSPIIDAQVEGVASSFRDSIGVCLYSAGANTVKVGVGANTLHLIDGIYQVAGGQMGVLWLPWLDGTRIASEISDLYATLTSPLSRSETTPENAPRTTLVSSGTGFFINQRVVITNQHVIDGCDQVSILNKGSASVIAEDESTDLAAIYAKNPSDTYLKLSSESVTLGEDISTFGYPLQQILSPTIHMTKGNVSSLAGLSGNTGLFQMTAPIQPGNSGGPVINKAGEVVGVATSTLNPKFALRELDTLPQGVNFAVRASLVSNLLEIYGITEGPNAVSLSSVAGSAEAAVVKVECRN